MDRVSDKGGNGADYYKRYVLTNLNVGDTFIVIGDLYNNLHQKGGKPSKRKVVRFYPNYVLTVDVCGRNENFGYFDLYKILRNGGVIENEVQRETDD